MSWLTGDRARVRDMRPKMPQHLSNHYTGEGQVFDYLRRQLNLEFNLFCMDLLPLPGNALPERHTFAWMIKL